MTTQAERLATLEARINTLIEGVKTANEKLDRLETEMQADKADLAALKNKGWGILLGVSLGAASIGAGLKSIIVGIITALK